MKEPMPIELAVGAWILAAAVAAYFAALVWHPQMRLKRVHWGRSGTGPEASRLSKVVGAFAVPIAIVAVTSEDFIPERFHFVVVSVGAVAGAAIVVSFVHDWIHQRMGPNQPPEPMRANGPHGSP